MHRQMGVEKVIVAVIDLFANISDVISHVDFDDYLHDRYLIKCELLHRHNRLGSGFNLSDNSFRLVASSYHLNPFKMNG